MLVGVVRETFPGERRVALVPDGVTALKRLKLEVAIEAGAGVAAGYDDAAFTAKGARIEANRGAVLGAADVVLMVRGPGANPEAGADVAVLKRGAVLVSFMDPLAQPEAALPLATRGVTALAMELVPRITRAQGMDALSSMASIAGYKAVLAAADHLPRLFPMMMTAAGTIPAARVFVIGAGVAGLQAIATARRLGAVVEAYDTRPAVKEQVESLGARFVELTGLDTATSEDKGGYARAQSDEFYRKQQEAMTSRIHASDVVITTAAVPGKRAPVLVSEAQVKTMRRGSVVVDLASDKGGNCALTQPGKVAVAHGVTIVGTLNVPSGVPFHASQMYSRNLTNLLALLVKDGALHLDLNDEIVKGAMVTHDGRVVHPAVLKALQEAGG
jgi:NAD(P) transhydrogenase subunit alpha